jgi:hypothetical protein
MVLAIMDDGPSFRAVRTVTKYAIAETAEKILRDRTLLWCAPELFNDPFEFKNPF